MKQKLWRDVAVYSALFLLVLAVLAALGAKVPSPIKAIQTLCRDILHLSFKIS